MKVDPYMKDLKLILSRLFLEGHNLNREAKLGRADGKPFMCHFNPEPVNIE